MLRATTLIVMMAISRLADGKGADLTCHGVLAHKGATTSVVEIVSTTYHIDLSKKRWCSGSCSDMRELSGAGDGRWVLDRLTNNELLADLKTATISYRNPADGGQSSLQCVSAPLNTQPKMLREQPPPFSGHP